MKHAVFSVYDTKAKAYLPPFFAPNAAVACRMISDAVEQRDHMFSRHAADFVLFQISEWTDDDAMFYDDTQTGGAFPHVNLGCLITFVSPDNVVPMKGNSNG